MFTVKSTWCSGLVTSHFSMKPAGNFWASTWYTLPETISEGSDEPVHLHKLITVFAARMHKVWKYTRRTDQNLDPSLIAKLRIYGSYLFGAAQVSLLAFCELLLLFIGTTYVLFSISHPRKTV